jgi:Ni/Co efflux regulator RcnB
MKIKTFVSLAVTASLLAANPVFAQGRSDDGRDDDPVYRADNQRGQASERGMQQRNDRHGQPQNRNRRNDRRDDNYGDRQQARNDDRQGPGAGPQRDFYRGDRLSPEYRDHSYVVEDWRGHHLRQPPRGYHWVQVGGDYVLAAIATGIIVDLLLLNHR